jgi:RNA polymerase sigma factor (sigma-70 family)
MPDSKTTTPEPAADEPVTLAGLFRVEEGPLLRYAYGLTGRRALAEEVVQESFLRLHRQWGEVAKPRPWLYRCVRNLAFNEIRDHARETPADPATEATRADPRQATPDAELARHEAIGTLRLLLAGLEAEDARLIDLKYMHHKSYAEIAAATGTNIGTVGYKLHHLLKQLAAALRRAGIDNPEV